MRCKNCGWENPEGLQKCEKCNAPLRGSMIDHGHQTYGSSKDFEDTERESLRATVRESNVFSSIPKESEIDRQNCPNCGYELALGMKVCPACGTSIENKRKKQSNSNGSVCPKCGSSLQSGARFCPICGTSLRAGTVNAWDNPQHNEFCSLKPIHWSNEEASYSPISYSGKIIVLNRANTDPNNQSITSKEQAVLTREGDSWYIEDKSEQHSTMIRVSKKTKLESGDIIALGNRLFEFKG